MVYELLCSEAHLATNKLILFDHGNCTHPMLTESPNMRQCLISWACDQEPFERISGPGRHIRLALDDSDGIRLSNLNSYVQNIKRLVSLSIQDKLSLGVHQGEPLSPILGLNPCLSRL